jgi:hypothetical protein
MKLTILLLLIFISCIFGNDLSRRHLRKAKSHKPHRLSKHKKHSSKTHVLEGVLNAPD